MKSKSKAARKSNPKVAVIMGSDSDLPVMKDASDILETLGVECEVTIVSAHRTPERLYRYARTAEERGIKVVIAGAGGAAHLPGMTAAMTSLPVIGVPVKSASLNGLDSLLSIVQMPAGIPVATVAINGARNAGLLAASILALSDARVCRSLKEYRKNQERKVRAQISRLGALGTQAYLNSRA